MSGTGRPGLPDVPDRPDSDPETTQDAAPAEETTMNDEHDQTRPTQAAPSGEATESVEDRHTLPLGRFDAPDEPWHVTEQVPADDRTGPPRAWPTGGPAAAPSVPARLPAPVATDVRVGTVVWGLVLTAVGIGLLALASGLSFDVELAFIALVALAGVGLVVGAVTTGVRRGRRTT